MFVSCVFWYCVLGGIVFVCDACFLDRVLCIVFFVLFSVLCCLLRVFFILDCVLCIVVFLYYVCFCVVVFSIV